MQEAVAKHSMERRSAPVQLACADPARLFPGAASVDAALLSLAAEFGRLQGLIDPLMEEFSATALGDPKLEAIAEQEVALTGKQDELADRMLVTSARTSAGLVAKAAVAREIFLRHHEEEIEGDFMDEETAFAWSLIQDILGRA